MGSNKSPLQIVGELNYTRLMIFVSILSLIDKVGHIQMSGVKLLKLINGFGPEGQHTIAMSPAEFRNQLKKMTYLGIFKARGTAEPNHFEKTLMYGEPFSVSDEFLNFMPKTMRGNIDSTEIGRLKLEIREDAERKRELNRIIRRLREEIKVANTVFVPEFKMENLDGSINKRSIEFRKLWSWFIILGIERAFETVKYKNKDPENPIKDLDYATMAVWLSQYELENIEGLLAKFYSNQRLRHLKEEAGENWITAVKSFLFGALKKQFNNTRGKDDKKSTYVPRNPERDPSKYGNQIDMPGVLWRKR